MSDCLTITVEVHAEDLAASNRQTQQLERIISEQAPEVVSKRRKHDLTTLDGGSMLALVLASPALLELAKALRVFLTRYHSSKITIRDESGSAIAENISAADAASALAGWARSRNVSRAP